MQRVLVKSLINSKIRHTSQIEPIDGELLDDLAGSISKLVKKTNPLQYNMSNEYIFIDQDKGGLGFEHPRYTSLISFVETFMSLINNSDDTCKSINRQAWTECNWKSLKETLETLDLQLFDLKNQYVPEATFPDARISDGSSVWTDGSYYRSNGRTGGGIVIDFKGETNTHAIRLQPHHDNAWAEMYTALVAILMTEENASITINTDYKNLVDYMNNGGNLKKKIQYHQLTDSIQKVMELHKIKVKWNHVESHCGIALNELADKTAKEGAQSENFTCVDSLILKYCSDKWFLINKDNIWPDTRGITRAHIQKVLIDRWENKTQMRNLSMYSGNVRARNKWRIEKMTWRCGDMFTISKQK
ncbi:hypothetical protein AKO1_005860 [Acrasis kona]|uniref:RNase H type-1 domain-containing protein n=1 Tax=Acrasis kona TaxID=1008807 RepID=A0AAW2YIZ0_9EUKA